MKKSFVLLIFFISLLNINALIFNDKTSDNNIPSVGLISVTIGGEFIVNGSFPAYINERVDQFVTRLFNETKTVQQGKITDPDMLKLIEKEYEKYPLRNITLKRANGEELKLDLLKFRKTGDFSNNPYLKNDDVLIFPPTDLDRNFFTITGAVNTPGKFIYFDGDKLSDAIILADGINKAYENVEKVEINRLNYNGTIMEIIPLDIDSDVPIQRGDRIVVLADETQRKEFNVVVFGEVKRPGTIPITKNNTNLKTVIEGTGGFTEVASLKRAKLFRGNKNIRFILEHEFGLDLENIDEYLRGWPNPLLFEYEKNTMLRMSNLTEEDTTFFIVDEEIREMINEASIDFTDVLNENSETSKLKVMDGDIIIVPPIIHTVYVFGQVNNPGLVKYLEGKDYKYYINEAGGFGALAKDEDEIMIIKGESKKWINAMENPYIIEPGDFVYIPKNPNRSFNYYVGIVGNYFSIVGSIATIILLLVQFGK